MTNPYDTQFQLARGIVLKRDSNICVDCGKSDINAVVHHLDYTSNEPDNLVTICLSCHRKKHLKGSNNTNGSPVKTITVKDKTHARLQNAGTYSDSMDSIINRLLDVYEKK